MASESGTVTITENKSIDSVINKSMHNLFVDGKNLKQNLVIPLSNVNSKIVVENVRGDGTGERYNPVLQERSVYSKCIEKDMKVKININDVVTKERSTQYKVVTNSDSAYVATHRSWNSNPWNAGLLRHRTDFINSCCQSTNVVKGNVSGSGNFTLTPQLVNILRKLEDQEMIQHTYKGVLRPETFNLNYKINLSSDDKLMGRKLLADDTASSGQLVPAGTGTYTIDSPVTSLATLNKILPPQQQFDKAEYIFKKKLPSYNYKWDMERKELKKSLERTTELYCMKVGKSSYPTNIENYTDFLSESGGSPGLASVYWFTDKKALIKRPANEEGVPSPANGDDEPEDQKLNIEITFDASGPILHPLLETLPGISFTNIQTFKIESNYHSDLFNSMFYNIYKPGEGEKLGTPKVHISNQKIRLTQLDCSLLEHSIKQRIVLPFIQYKEFTDTKKLKLVKEGSKVGFKPFTFNLSCGFNGMVPKRTIIFISNEENLPYTISDLALTFAGQNSVIQQTADDLVNATRQNGMYMTAEDQFNSYRVLSRYNNIKTIPSQCGTVLYLEYGNNLPIHYNSSRPLTASSFADGMSSDYKITIDGMFETDLEYDMDKEYTLQINVYHLNDAEAIYHKNRMDIEALGFKNEDLASALIATKEAAESNELVMNVDDVVHAGGKNSMSKIKRKVKSSAPSAPSSSSSTNSTNTTKTTGFMSDFVMNR